MIAQQQRSVGDFVVQEVDISDSDALFERYGLRIPVLQHPDQRELGWHFSAEQLVAFLSS